MVAGVHEELQGEEEEAHRGEVLEEEAGVVVVALVETAVLEEAGVDPEAAFLAGEAGQAGFVVVEAVGVVTVDHSIAEYTLFLQSSSVKRDYL